MKPADAFILFVVVVVGCTIANLVALKIAGDAVAAQVDGSPTGNLLKLLK